MAKVYEFPSTLEDTINLTNATHWTPSIDQGSYTAGKTYKIYVDYWTEDYYVTDDNGISDFTFCLVCPGEYIKDDELITDEEIERQYEEYYQWEEDERIYRELLKQEQDKKQINKFSKKLVRFMHVLIYRITSLFKST